jgi:hypothetical protein
VNTDAVNDLYLGILMHFISVVWAATTKDSDYIRMQGMKRVVNDACHRKEIVAGGMREYMVSREYFI